METATPASRRSPLGGMWPYRSDADAPPLAGPVPAPPADAPPGAPEKIGAGLLLTCKDTGAVLLLLRNSLHNNLTWGLPGGNAEEADGARGLAPTCACKALTPRAGGDLWRTARREAVEELGPLPPHVVVGEYITRRGKVDARRPSRAPFGLAPLTRRPRFRNSGARSSTPSSCASCSAPCAPLSSRCSTRSTAKHAGSRRKTCAPRCREAPGRPVRCTPWWRRCSGNTRAR